MIADRRRVVVARGAGGPPSAVWLSVARIGAHPGGGERHTCCRRAAGEPVRIVLSGHHQLPESAGLLPNQDVTRCAECRSAASRRLRDHRPGGVNAIVNIRRRCGYRLQRRPRVGTVAGRRAVHRLRRRIRMPGRICTTAASSTWPTRPCRSAWRSCSPTPTGLLAQVDPAKVELIKKELSLSEAGPQKLADDHRRRNLPAVDAGFGASGDHQRACRTSRVVLTLASRQEHRNRRHRNQLSQTLHGVSPNAGRIPAA